MLREIGDSYAPGQAVVDMDLLAFQALYESVKRTDAARKIEGIWTAVLAAQGRQEDVKKWIEERWAPLLPKPEKEEGDVNAFLTALKSMKLR